MLDQLIREGYALTVTFERSTSYSMTAPYIEHYVSYLLKNGRMKYSAAGATAIEAVDELVEMIGEIENGREE